MAKLYILFISPLSLSNLISYSLFFLLICFLIAHKTIECKKRELNAPFGNCALPVHKIARCVEVEEAAIVFSAIIWSLVRVARSSTRSTDFAFIVVVVGAA